MQAESAEVRERLLKAWRGEIIAGGVYDLIARRMAEREGDILRRMAQAESGHRGRLEARMRELGITVPDPAGVKLALWLRLQARIAPVDRLLAAREAAEDEEVDDLYKRPTGDPVTDELLRDIRKEERFIRSPCRTSGLGALRDRAAAPARRSIRRRWRFGARGPGSTGSSAARNGTAPGAAGAPGRSVEPTMDSRPCSGSWPASRVQRRIELGAHRRAGGGNRLGAVDGHGRVPGRALRVRGGGCQRRARASGDR